MKRTYATILAVTMFAARLVSATETNPVPRVPPDTKAIVPVLGTRSGQPTKGHIRFCAQAKAGGFEVLFLGDSITANWAGPGKETWDRVIAPRTAANFGFPGNRTEDVLWGLDNGLMEGELEPKAIVLMIGTNNTRLRKDPPEAIAAGVGAIVDRLYKRFPKAHVLLFGIFPAGATPDDPVRKNNDAVNSLLAKFEGYHNVRYRDIGPKLLERDGTLSKDVMPDLLHPGPRGYEIWGAALEPELKALLATASSTPKGKVRLFILSGQSNMVYLDESKSFTPAIKKAFPGDEIIVVRYAVGGTPIRLWFKDWKAPEGADASWTNDKEKQGSLYDTLMQKVEKAIEGKTPDSVSFVWMQGERDAKGGVAASYENGLRGLIRKVREDMKRDDVTVVIGRLSDHLKGKKEQWDAVRSIQEGVAAGDPRAAWVDTDALNGPNNDLHYSKEGFVELGRLFAEKTIELLSK